MSGRPTTRRSTRWSRLPLLLAVVAAIALPSLIALGDSNAPVDVDRVASATMSNAHDDTPAVVSLVRAERSALSALLVTGTAVATVLTSRAPRPATRGRDVRASDGVPGGVGLRAPPARARA